MPIRLYRAYTPGTRNRSVPKFDGIIRSGPQKRLTYGRHIKQGRNNRGVITSRHRGGGHKRLYRIIDFRRNKRDIPGKIKTIEYDPNRNAYIRIINYEDGEKRYIPYPRGIKIGDTIISSLTSPISIGNSLPLSAVRIIYSRKRKLSAKVKILESLTNSIQQNFDREASEETEKSK